MFVASLRVGDRGVGLGMPVGLRVFVSWTVFVSVSGCARVSVFAQLVWLLSSL